MAKQVVSPHWYQERTLDSAARYIVLIGGTGGGKTWWGPVWLADRITRDHEDGVQDARYLALGPTSEMARDQMQPYLAEHYKGTLLEGEWQAQARIYQLPTGGKIYFRSADKPERVEGHHFRAAWIDEPGQMKGLIWPIIQGRTGYHKAKVLFTGYPWAMNWYYHEIYKRWEGGDPDYDVIQFRSIDNPAYPKEEYERAKATLPGWMFDMRYDGKFRKPAGLVYPEFGEHMFIEPFDVPTDWPVYVGLDPSVFFGALFLAWNDGTYYAYSDYYTEILAPAAEHAKELKQRIRGMVQAWIYDPARLTDVNELAQHGIGPLVMANNPVLPGIGTTTEFIKSGRLKVMRGRSPALVDQMEKYTFPVDPVTQAIGKENPIKKDDHLCLAAGTLIETITGPVPIEEVEVADLILTSKGYRSVVEAGMTNLSAEVMRVLFSDGRELIGTANHPVFVEGKGYIELRALRYGDIIVSCKSKSLNTGGSSSADTPTRRASPIVSTSRQVSRIALMAYRDSTRRYGKITTGRSRKAITSITRTATGATTSPRTLGAYQALSTSAVTTKEFTRRCQRPRERRLPTGTGLKLARHIIANSASWLGRTVKSFTRTAIIAALTSRNPQPGHIPAFVLTLVSPHGAGPAALITKPNHANGAANCSPKTNTPQVASVPIHVLRVSVIPARRPVYNLSVDGAHEYFANGILVHNCDCLRYILHTQEGNMERGQPFSAVV